MASEIKVDTVSEKTSGSGVTIDGLLIKDGGISGDVSLIGTTPTFTIGDAGAEDAALVFDGNAQDFYIALDDSADDLLIGLGSTVGTTPAISIDENLQVKIVATTASTSATTGSFIAAGGAGIAADLHVGDDVTLISDSAVLGFGADKDTTLTHTDGTGLTLNSTNKLCFNDASQFIQGASATVLDIAATDEIELTATLIDVVGNFTVSGEGHIATLGVDGTHDLGTGLHIRTADSGGSVQDYADELVIEGGSAGTGMTILCHNDQSGSIMFGDQNDNDVGFIQYSHGSNYMRFTTNGAERVRFTSGGIIGIGQALDGVSSDSTIGASMHPEGRVNICYSGTGGHALMTFRNGNNEIGSISNSGTSGIAYNTSSDYRLKENVDYNFDATTRLKQLKPARFNFKADEDNTLVDGFLAHEVSSVVPEAVRGAKDAVDDDGNAVHQGIDQSKLVPLLVKTVLELEARIKTLEDA